MASVPGSMRWPPSLFRQGEEEEGRQEEEEELLKWGMLGADCVVTERAFQDSRVCVKAWKGGREGGREGGIS